MTKNESLQKALDALGPTPPDCCGCQTEWQIAITAIKTALEALQQTWVGLTDKEVNKIIGSDRYSELLKAVVQTVEAKLKEKNT